MAADASYKGRPPGVVSSLKRKAPSSSSQSPQASRSRKRFKLQDARMIAAQTNTQAFDNGEIDVDKFVKARAYEITALEAGIRSSKKALSARAFQNVPRDLRRRTASHNVKRVPKRLRSRAAREMADDNTPNATLQKRKPTLRMRLRLDTVARLNKLSVKAKKTKKGQAPTANEPTEAVESAGADVASTTATKVSGPGSIATRLPRAKKNTLQKPQIPKAKFRKRQIHKAWLPTHIYHAKRAHMTPPKEPLWRMAIALSPTAKNYRPTHRATHLRGGMAWDTSYLSTIGLAGPESAILMILQKVGLTIDSPSSNSQGSSSRWRKGTRALEGWLHEPETMQVIAPVSLVWCARQKAAITNTSANAKRTAFMRLHPSAFLQTWQVVLKLANSVKGKVTVEDLRFQIGSLQLTGPAVTEALVSTLQPCPGPEDHARDSPATVWPTLIHLNNPASLPANVVIHLNVSDPRLRLPRRIDVDGKQERHSEKLLEVLTRWPLDEDHGEPSIFSSDARHNAVRRMPSQKAINRRRALSEPGETVKWQVGDPEIPVLLTPSRGTSNQDGFWTVLMPWKCILPVWYSLMYHPLSSGGTLRFGGLTQIRQIAFEAGRAWFPADFPGTPAGMTWESKEQERRHADWSKRPKGKRTEYDSIVLGRGRKGELGRGWACDWQYLAGTTMNGVGGQQIRPFHQSLISGGLPADCTRDIQTRKIQGMAVCTVRLSVIGRGVPVTCARIYRLPSDEAWRSRWVSLADLSRAGKREMYTSLPVDTPKYLKRRALAEALLNAPSKPVAGEATYPDVPDEEDLIGFVTTGNFSLGQGKGIGIGAIAWEKVVGQLKTKHGQLCVFRNAGESLGRLARFEFI